MSPRWSCPGGQCNCHPPRGEEKSFTFSVLLRESTGERMPGARCRVWFNGRIVNEDQPHADGDGWLRVELPESATWALLEWAPHDTPLRDPYPYRNQYFVHLVPSDARESGRRRLHNLGFSRRPRLADNVGDYQAATGAVAVTGRLEDVAEQLAAYHDVGRGSSRSDVVLASDQQAAPQDEGTPPPTRPSGTGRKTPVLPTPLEVATDRNLEGEFDFGRITSTARGKVDGKPYEAHFWVMTDAYKWVVPDKCTAKVAQWCAAISLYTPTDDVMVAPGTRTLRLPTNVFDATAWCQLHTHHQKSKIFRDAEADGGAPNSHQICLLPTPRLYQLRYMSPGALQVPSLPGPHGLLARDAIAFNERVNKTAKALLGSRARPPTMLVDPGKTWAIQHMMDRKNFRVVGGVKKPFPSPCSVGFHATDKAAVNYGFHSGGGTPAQREANCHGKGHVDYSQLLVAVAGWCEVRETGGTWSFMRTADVYTHPNLCPLAVRGGSPLKKPAYELP